MHVSNKYMSSCPYIILFNVNFWLKEFRLGTTKIGGFVCYEANKFLVCLIAKFQTIT
jgi:hypothetical protein